jgi:hypothetical protein
MPELPSPSWEVGGRAIGQTMFAGGSGQESRGHFVVLGEN